MTENGAVREIHVGSSHNTSEALRHAQIQAAERGLYDFVVIDADAHHYEGEVWSEIKNYIEDPLIRYEAKGGGPETEVAEGVPLMVGSWGNQFLSGRIPRMQLRRQEAADLAGAERDALIIERTMEAMAIDYQIVFPTPMLSLGLHPEQRIETAIARAYSRWVCERILPHHPGIKTMLYLPFNDPAASLRLVEDFAGIDGVVGFVVTGVRYTQVSDNAYASLYSAIEERGQPLAFHGGYRWGAGGDRSFESLNRFISVHAIGFPLSLMLHVANWVINGLPERYPSLRTLWIEGGLAWIPFLMQRLDHEYLMRTSEAPLLKRLPSEYMRDLFYTSQPLERTDDEALELTFRMINANTQLLYSSDYPHWDFDTPARIYDLPFLNEQSKRNILGSNAARLFGLPSTPRLSAPAVRA